jgi:hypothetical protein
MNSLLHHAIDQNNWWRILNGAKDHNKNLDILAIENF